MIAKRGRIDVAVDVGELVDTLQYSTTRDKADEVGTRGVLDGFGRLALRVNGEIEVVLRMHIENGHLVIDMENDGGDLLGRRFID